MRSGAAQVFWILRQVAYSHLMNQPSIVPQLDEHHVGPVVQRQKVDASYPAATKPLSETNKLLCQPAIFQGGLASGMRKRSCHRLAPIQRSIHDVPTKRPPSLVVAAGCPPTMERPQARKKASG